jgi:hypothetical protein
MMRAHGAVLVACLQTDPVVIAARVPAIPFLMDFEMVCREAGHDGLQ